MKEFLKGVLVVTFVLILTVGCKKKVVKDDVSLITFTLSDLKVSIPAGFTKSSESTDNMIFYNYASDDKKNGCYSYFTVFNYSADDLKAIVKNGMMEAEDVEYSTKEINGNTWTVGKSTKSNKYTKYHYAINYNNKRYEFDYDDMGSGDLCEKYLKTIEQNLKF